MSDIAPQISDLNPQYVWGGDAITLDGSSDVWVDHVTTSKIGRQHIVTGNSQNTGVTISNSKTSPACRDNTGKLT